MFQTFHISKIISLQIKMLQTSKNHIT